MDEIHREFKLEAKDLFVQMGEVLDQLENHEVGVQSLEKVGQLVDRILGASKTLAISSPYKVNLEKIGDFALLCKVVSYKGSQIPNKPNLTDVIVALLQDILEQMNEMVKTFEVASVEREAERNAIFNRLQWLSEQFSKELRSSVALDVKKDQHKPVELESITFDKLIKDIKNKS